MYGDLGLCVVLLSNVFIVAGFAVGLIDGVKYVWAVGSINLIKYGEDDLRGESF